MAFGFLPVDGSCPFPDALGQLAPSSPNNNQLPRTIFAYEKLVAINTLDTGFDGGFTIYAGVIYAGATANPPLWTAFSAQMADDLGHDLILDEISYDSSELSTGVWTISFDADTTDPQHKRILLAGMWASLMEYLRAWEGTPESGVITELANGYIFTTSLGEDHAAHALLWVTTDLDTQGWTITPYAG